MKEINPELVKNLYAKYSPETDVESKMAYIQEKYGDNQDEFVRNFYAKYDPSVDVDSKIEYINKAYTVKKKEDSEPTARWEDLALPTEQVEEGPISLEYSQQKILDEQEPVAPLLEDKADPSSPDFKFDVQEVQEVSELNEKPSVQIEDKIEDTERTIGINKAKDLIVSPITEDEAQTEQDRINSISIKNKFPESANDPVVLRNSEDQFERGIGRINDLFSQTEAKAAADLRKAFDQYGFKFEEAVGGIDAIKVTSANGKEITVRRKVGNKDAKVTELKDFLNENRVASTVVQNRINTSLGKDTKKEKRALTEEDLEEESKIYTNQFDSYQKNVSDYNKRKKALSNSTPTNEQEIAVYNKEAGNLNALSVSLNKEQENLISSQGELEKLAGDYAYYESQKWDVPSLMIQSIANGLLSASVGVGSFIADAVDVADLSWITGDDDKENDAVYKAFKDKLREGRDMILEDLQILGTTTKAIEKVKKNSFVAGALIGTLESIPAMVAGIGGLFAHSYAGADDALRQYKGYEDIGDLEAFTLKVGLSAAGAYLEKAGLDNAMGKTGLLNRFLLQTLKTIPKDASEIVVHQTLKRKAIDFVKGLGSATAGEGATGGAQEAVDIGIKAAYNEMKGINVFKTPETIGQFFEQVVEASAAEAIGGLALGGAGSVATALSNEKVIDLPDGVIEMFEMMSSSNKFDPLFSKSLKVQLAKGEITKEEAQEQLDNYHEAKSSMKQIPKDYTTPQKKMALSLLGFKKRLEKEIEGKDPDLVKDLKEQLDDVKERLSTVKKDVTNIKEGVEITDPNETYFFDFKSKKEIPDALKGLKPVAETISKRSKLGKTQNIRLGFKGTQLVESGFAKIDNEIKLLEENRSKELKEIDDKKFDDTLDLVTDENGKTYRNTKARQKKAEQDRINKVYDDKIAKLNIEKEKATEAETKKDVESEAKEQSTLVKEGEIAEDKSTEAETIDDVKEVSEPVKEVPSGEVAPSEKSVDEQVDVLTNILEGKTPVEETKALPRKQIDNQVDNAKKALSKVAPEVEIIVSESEAEYKKATKEGRNQSTGGRYIDGKIYINPNRANKRTVAHEVFHALLLSKGRTDQQAQAITERMMEAVKKNADQELIDRLEKFSSNYKKALESEESIAELIGILADGYPQLNAEAKSLIKRWLDKLAKIFGLKPLTSDTDIINFLNTVSDKIASGKNIKSRDVKVLGDIDSEVKNLAGKTPNEIVNSVREQKGLINLSEQEVLKYARAGIENQYEAQAIKQIGLQGVTFTKEGIQGKVKEELDSLIKESDNYIMSEDSKAVDGAIQFEINTLINDGASEAQIENAKQAFQPGSMRDNFINKYKETQKETLDQWKSYLSESDYNDSFKYLILDAVLTNNYDFKTNKYTKRNNKTIRNYTPFDAGTLASLYASDSKSLLKDYVEIQVQNSKNVVESSSFVSTKEGEWLKFEGGPSVSNEVRVENANKLSQIVQNTYWCTKTNAKGQLDGGDFYVYATKNSEGEYESRVAVRMEGDKVGEVRGNASSNQDLEPDMMPVADKFLKENIPNGSGKKWLDSIEYNTRVKELTEKIEGKKVTGQSLEEYLAIIKDSGKFKVDYGENGLVTKLKKVFKNSEFDFPVARNLRELRPDTVLFIGDFNPISEVSSNVFPKYVIGTANFADSQVTDLGQLQSIGGHANFSYSQVTDLGQLQSIGGDADFGRSKVTNLGKLQSIGGYANFGRSKVTNLGKLQSIGGTAYFQDSKVTNLGQLQSIGSNAYFGGSKVTDLGKLQSIGRDADFGGSEITDLGQLQSIVGIAYFKDSKVTNLGQLQSIGHAYFEGKIGLRLKWQYRKTKLATQSRQQKSDKPSITEVRRIAKENGLKEEAVDKVLKNLGYTSAEISESIEIENEIERQSKKSIKRPISAKKIIGKSKRDKVTVDEMAALKGQIRLEAKAAKGAKTDLNQKRKDLAKIIKDFEKGKNITTAKSQTIINRISKVNLDNEVAVEKLLDYIAKQYGIAKVKEETSASNTKRNRAKNNIKSKIGTAKDTFNIFKKLFSYDSKLITDKKLKAKYEAIVGRFGSSSAVLSVKDLKSEAEIAKEIIESIEEEYSTFEDLADVFYENMVKDEDGNIDYKATMKVLSEGTETILVPDQLAILEKYKSKLELKEAKESLTPEQQKVVTEGLIDEAMKVKVKNNVTDDKNSRESAGKLIKLLENRKNLEGLSDNQLKSIPQILDNIQNGIFTFRANTIMNALDVKENSDAITIKLNKARAMAIESIIRGLQSTLPFQATSAYNQIASNPLKDIDTILGLDGTEVYDRTFKRMGSAFAAFQEATRDVNEKLTEVNTKLTKAFNAKENEISQAKFRMQAYMLQLEYESNKELQGKKGTVFEAVDWIDATINELVGKKQEATIKILRKVREQVKGKSSQEIKSKLTRVEKEAISIVKKINEETAEKALYVGAIVRGSRPNMINEYTHHDIMSTADLSKKEATDYLNKMNNVKTKAGTIESRSSGVKPINMDILNSTMKGAKQTLLDFHVTNENRVIKKTLSEVKKKVEDKSENKRNNKILKAAEISPQEFAVAMEEAYDKAMSIAFSNSYGSTSVLDKMVSFGYQAQLASVPRAFAELSSNLGYVALSSPKLFTEGVSLFTKIGLAESIEYMKLSGSSELGKFTGAKNTGKSVDMLAKNADLSKAKGRNDLANFVKTAKNTQAGALVNKAAETAADILISTPDKAVSMPLWLGSFTRSMKEKGLDLEKFKSDESYRTDNAKAIESARNEADQELNRAAGSQNIFASVLKNKVDKANDSAGKQARKYVNGYLTNFLIFEYSTARKGIIQITKEGKINKLEGLSLLAATTTRMASYSILYKIFSSLFFGAFGAEDEQEDELEANDVTRAIVGSGVSLLLGRNFGTIARKGLNFGTEFLNKEYGQVLRGDEEYDSFEHGLGLAFFNPSEEDLKRKRLEKKVFREISGPLSNHVGLLFDMTYSAYDYINAKNDQEKSKAADKLIGQVLFETFGLFVGKTPLFKDLKKGLYQIPTNNEFAIKDKQYSYSELKGENEIKFATEEEKFQSKPEIKKIDIDLNKVTRLIKGGTLSEENEIKAKRKQSSLTKTKKDLKREYMNKQFGFKDKKDIGKVSKNDNVNDKSIDEQMAEMEIIDERTYKEYKEENERKYNKTLRKYKSNRTYRKSEDQKSKLTRKLKDAQRKKRDNLIPELKAKIKLIQQEMKGNKREFFSKAFKK